MTSNLQLRQLGTTAVKVLPYGLGAAHIPEGGKKVAIATVRKAIEQGVQFIDTAPLYSAGRSERFIGQALTDVPRESYVLATKVGKLVLPGEGFHIDYSRDGILQSLEESLQRLKLDSVDILHIHDPDDHYRQALDEAFPALADLRSQGVIKAIGSGMNQWQMLRDFARNADFDCFLLAGRYTLLEQTSLDFLDLCLEKQIGVILGGVYNSGILASDLQADATYNYRAAPSDILEKARKINAVCGRHNVPLNVAALKFPLAHPAVTSMVIGAESPNQVIANLAAQKREVPNDLWAELKKEGLIESNAPVAS
ncbi:aldo/keto reductase [Chloroflexi bacterium TSY]|nr:aldo/keto reductase [Chloroflexi bacterium TSY]